MKKYSHIHLEWQELIWMAKYRCVFGEQLDTELFKSCMKDAYEFLAVGKEKKVSFTREEVELYGLIYGYSCIPAATKSECSDEFEASTHIAFNLAHSITCPEVYTFEDSKMIYEYRINNGFKPVIYDFETGDMSAYVELVEMHYWDE